MGDQGVAGSRDSAGQSSIIIYTIGALTALEVVGIAVTPLMAGLGIGGIAAALALQPALSNVFSGVFMLTEGELNPGDFIPVEVVSRGEAQRENEAAKPERDTTGVDESGASVVDGYSRHDLVTGLGISQNEVSAAGENPTGQPYEDHEVAHLNKRLAVALQGHVSHQRVEAREDERQAKGYRDVGNIGQCGVGALGRNGANGVRHAGAVYQ